MFTGIIQTVGTVRSLQRGAQSATLVVDAPELRRPIADGASVCVNGVCLTVTFSNERLVSFDVVNESLQRSTLGGTAAGQPVNLEPSLRVGDPMDGHYVQGHVDGTAKLSQIGSGDTSLWWFEVEGDLIRYIVPKGSIAIDGISLTVAALQGNRFGVAFIPTTLETTTMGGRQVGDRVNIETDILVRTVVATLERQEENQSTEHPSTLTVEGLKAGGW
jgi:riboflavin synthase